jgi:hypothetical protein
MKADYEFIASDNCFCPLYSRNGTHGREPCCRYCRFSHHASSVAPTVTQMYSLSAMEKGRAAAVVSN